VTLRISCRSERVSYLGLCSDAKSDISSHLAGSALKAPGHMVMLCLPKLHSAVAQRVMPLLQCPASPANHQQTDITEPCSPIHQQRLFLPPLRTRPPLFGTLFYGISKSSPRFRALLVSIVPFQNYVLWASKLLRVLALMASDGRACSCDV
jgi:hypothetical protein